MSERTFFGLVAHKTYLSGVSVWGPTYDAEDMFKPAHQYVACSTFVQGHEALIKANPVPKAFEGEFGKVFRRNDRHSSREAELQICILPHPMLLANVDPENKEAAHVQKFLEILSDPVTGGRFYLPNPHLLDRLFGNYNSYSQGSSSNPAVKAGQPYYNSTTAAFTEIMRKFDGVRKANMVFGSADLLDGGANGRTVTVRIDNKAAAIHAKSAITRARTKAAKEEDAKRKQEEARAAYERSCRLEKVWNKLESVAIELLRGLPHFKQFYINFAGAHVHSAFRFQQAVKFHERLVGRGRWRKSSEVQDAMLAVSGYWSQVGGKDDPATNYDRAKPPHVRAAVKWLKTEINALVKKQRAAERKKVKAAKVLQPT